MVTNTERRAAETTFFFKVMGYLAAAKAVEDAESLADLCSDLEMIATHCPFPSIAHRAAEEASAAAKVLADIQSRRLGYAGPSVVLTRVDAPANFNEGANP